MAPKNGARAKSATSNQSSLQDFHACTSHYQPCDTRHICLLICSRLLPCRVILCTSRTYITNVSRKISDRHQGHAQKEFSQNAVSSHRRSPGPWHNGSIVIPLHVAGGIMLYILRDFGQFQFCRHGDKQIISPRKDMPFIRRGTDPSFDMSTAGEMSQQFIN